MRKAFLQKIVQKIKNVVSRVIIFFDCKNFSDNLIKKSTSLKRHTTFICLLIIKSTINVKSTMKFEGCWMVKSKSKDVTKQI